ncbi:chloride channel protein [Allorhizobium sp. BGMRC 0089]|uniref:chloride channel protein n=1 Tax=Allorhizobium sonneratiae TaxID=2934936 RepID=UPI0020342499|nr:chloride channel protein [Allorhizobium sonneratiae]MCM2292331.1 chloride channel protein [Allorhizobium sonneratiae]
MAAIDPPGAHSSSSWRRFLRIPPALRALVRADEAGLVLLGGGAGIVAAVCVALMVAIAEWMHHHLFAIEGYEVSGAAHIDPLRAAFVPAIGGILMGLIGWLSTRRQRVSIIDPVEANALYGGRIPLPGSLFLVLQTMVSNGFGASIGMEAGYTQIGSALASRIGQLFHVRRNDLRVLVGCGAAAAIAAAFNAPLTGAFYAYELIIATYSIASLAPVVVASILAVGTMRLLVSQPSFQVGFAGNLAVSDYVLVFVMALLSALVAIAMMRTVTVVEYLFGKSRLPVWMRPTVGGLCVGTLALITPAVLSSGHSALHVGFDAYYTAPFLVVLICLKVLSSAISIGSGFRGGLFFASLFLGAMLGKLVALGWMLAFGLAIPGLVVAIIGMCAMATAVLGAPLTMAFLALETTGSLPLTIAVLAAAVVSSMTVRRLFGYSFTTWRFHLRGEAIRSAADIGWIRDLSVGRMMRKDVRKVLRGTELHVLRRDFPLGAAQRVIVVDEDGRYVGIILVPELHRELPETTIAENLIHFADRVLLPDMNVREAMKAFSAAEADALAVIDNRNDRIVIGQLTEHHALRRYNEELDRRQNEGNPYT